MTVSSDELKQLEDRMMRKLDEKLEENDTSWKAKNDELKAEMTTLEDQMTTLEDQMTTLEDQMKLLRRSDAVAEQLYLRRQIEAFRIRVAEKLALNGTVVQWTNDGAPTREWWLTYINTAGTGAEVNEVLKITNEGDKFDDDSLRYTGYGRGSAYGRTSRGIHRVDNIEEDMSPMAMYVCRQRGRDRNVMFKVFKALFEQDPERVEFGEDGEDDGGAVAAGGGEEVEDDGVEAAAAGGAGHGGDG